MMYQRRLTFASVGRKVKNRGSPCWPSSKQFGYALIGSVNVGLLIDRQSFHLIQQFTSGSDEIWLIWDLREDSVSQHLQSCNSVDYPTRRWVFSAVLDNMKASVTLSDLGLDDVVPDLHE